MCFAQTDTDTLYIPDSTKCFINEYSAPLYYELDNSPLIYYKIISFPSNKENIKYEKTYIAKEYKIKKDKSSFLLDYKLKDEGFVLYKKTRVIWYKKKWLMEYKEGIWKKYDYEKNKLFYIRYMNDDVIDTLKTELLQK